PVFAHCVTANPYLQVSAAGAEELFKSVKAASRQITCPGNVESKAQPPKQSFGNPDLPIVKRELRDNVQRARSRAMKARTFTVCVLAVSLVIILARAVAAQGSAPPVALQHSGPLPQPTPVWDWSGEKLFRQ
ncbi:hypothetical protein MEN95_26415, partial [Dolichospermum sp. ST_sed7]|nr:hypothetical protein [Dolichospermum sp. ST_sed7]